MRKYLKKAITVASVALSVAVLSPKSASAVTFNFQSQANTGPLAGNVYSGSFSYNTSGLTGVGSESTTATAFSFNFPNASSTYSLANVQAAPIGFTNGVLSSWEFADTAATNTSASGTPSFVVSSGQGIPNFLYGFNNVSGESYPNANGSCPDALSACSNAEGSSSISSFSTTSIPEPESGVLALGVPLFIGLRILKKEKSSTKINCNRTYAP